MASLFNIPVCFVDDLGLTQAQMSKLSEDSQCPSFGDAAYTLMDTGEFEDLLESALGIKIEIPGAAEFVAFNG